MKCMGNERKARGMYERLDENLQEYYDTLMAKDFQNDLRKYTKKELAYLSKLYENKVLEIKSSSKCLTSEEVSIIVKANKLRVVISQRNIDVLKMSRGNNVLPNQKKIDARTKFNRLFK